MENFPRSIAIMATHGAGRGKSRVNLALDSSDVARLRILADRSGQSLNAYCAAILADAVEQQTRVVTKTLVYRPDERPAARAAEDSDDPGSKKPHRAPASSAGYGGA
jgi:hypothetical protein